MCGYMTFIGEFYDLLKLPQFIRLCHPFSPNTAAGTFTCTPEDETFLLTAQRDSRPHRGNPLDALSIDPATGK